MWMVGIWSIPKKIKTKEVNFYNSYTTVEDLQVREKLLAHPPHFVLNVVKKPCGHNGESI